jgi:hypothetical protein
MLQCRKRGVWANKGTWQRGTYLPGEATCAANGERPLTEKGGKKEHKNKLHAMPKISTSLFPQRSSCASSGQDEHCTRPCLSPYGQAYETNSGTHPQRTRQPIGSAHRRWRRPKGLRSCRVHRARGAKLASCPGTHAAGRAAKRAALSGSPWVGSSRKRCHSMRNTKKSRRKGDLWRKK